MLYEDPTKDISSDERFHVELHFSPGVNCCVQKELPPGPGFRPQSRSKSQNYAEFDMEPGTPPPPLVCSIKCSKDSFATVFEKQPEDNVPNPSDQVYDEIMEAQEAEEEVVSSNTAVSDPIEIKVTTLNALVEDDGKVRIMKY